jgi:stearoyl-CoA desaturase (Delta-9 desaturase)
LSSTYNGSADPLIQADKRLLALRPSLKSMSRTNQVVNLLAVLMPPVAFLLTVLFFWNELIGPTDIIVMVVMYLLTGFGITVGFHRLFTHRSFATKRWLEYTFAGLGQMAVQGPVVHWVADHRKHHAHSDEEGDPHSPHLVGDGIMGVLRGLFHAHVGWLFNEQGRADRRKYAKDLMDDPGLKRVSKAFPWFVLLSLLLPAAIAYGIEGTAVAALGGFVWGGLVRVFFLHHVTWSINSVCHFTGRQRFDIEDESRNVFWLALPSLGEAWHHNHHAFPRSATHGLKRWELDPSAGLIRLLRRLGLAWNVVEISADRQAQKLKGAAAQAAEAAKPAEKDLTAV